MALTDSIETADSWQQIITADGSEEFTLVFYAKWADAFGPRNPNGRFAEIGDPLVTGGGVVDDRMRLSRIMVSPTMNDKEGCKYEQVYTSKNVGLKKEETKLRTSWRANFSATMDVFETGKQISTAVGTVPGDYTGDNVTTLDEDSKIQKQLVFVPRLVYNASFTAELVDLSLYEDAFGRVNSAAFFSKHREVTTGDTAIAESSEANKWQFRDRGGLIADTHQWLFNDFNASTIGINKYNIDMSFEFKEAGWNGPQDSSGDPTGDTFYLTADFGPLFDPVKELRRPDSTVPGRT
jgi:hypothetical protein